MLKIQELPSLKIPSLFKETEKSWKLLNPRNKYSCLSRQYIISPPTSKSYSNYCHNVKCHEQIKTDQEKKRTIYTFTSSGTFIISCSL